MDYMTYIWIAATVLFVIVEAATVSLVSIWFIPGSIISLILSFFDIPDWVQIVVFIVVSLATLLLCKFVFKVGKKGKAVHTNADAVIGQTAIVTEEISNIDGKGAVKIMGKEWSARSDNDENIEIGTQVEVLSIQGVKLICKKKG